VVIATVFLTIIGMSAGIALASWHKGSERSDQGQAPVNPTDAPISPTPSGPPCRDESQREAAGRGAQGTLRIKLLLRTNSSAVWICEDDNGQLFYHGNRGGEQGEWIEGKTALFLTGVQPDGQGGYEVTAADGTRFSINSRRLSIVHKDGRLELQQAAG